MLPKYFLVISITVIIISNSIFAQNVTQLKSRGQKNASDSTKIVLKKNQKINWYFSDYTFGLTLIWITAEYYNYNSELSKYKNYIKNYDQMKEEREIEFLKIRKKIRKSYNCLKNGKNRYSLAKNILIGSFVASVLFRLTRPLFVHNKNKESEIYPKVSILPINRRILGVEISYNF